MLMVIFVPEFIFAANPGDVGKVYLSDGILSLSDGHRLNFKSVYNETSGTYETAYCVEHGSSLYSSTSMSSAALSSYIGDSNQKTFLSYALAYGYRTTSNAATALSISSEDGQKYAATQFVVWNILANNYDSNFNRTAGWYDYVSSSNSYHSGIMRCTEQLESSIRNAVRLRNSGIVVFNSVAQANNNTYAKTSMLDNRNTADVNELAERLIDYVTRLYNEYLNGTQYRGDQVDYWVNQLFDGSMTPEAVLMNILNSQECKNKFDVLAVEDFVRATYKIIFNRTPDASGLSYFVNRMNSGLNRVELVRLMMTTPEWSRYNDTLDVSSGDVEYYFDYEFPVGITPNASMVIENTSGGNVNFTSLGGNNKWRVTIYNGGRITLRLDYGRVSSPVVWTPSRANHQKVISISDYETVSRYVAFSAMGEISYNPTATNTATPTPVHTATPTPVPINHVTASTRIIKRGETVTSASYSDISIDTENGVISEVLCSFETGLTNLNGAHFYAVPRADVYAVIGNNQENSRERIYYAGQHLPLSSGANGVYVLSSLYGGVYDIYEADAPECYVSEDGVVATIFVEDRYTASNNTYTSVITNRTTSSDLVTIEPSGSITCINELIDVDVNVNKHLPQDSMSNEEYYELLESIVFGLYTSEEIEFFENQSVPADTLVGVSEVTVETDSNGDFVSANAIFEDLLANGNYYVREIYASPRIVLDDTRYPVAVNRYDADNSFTIDLNIDNELVEGRIVIFKYDEWYDTALEGAEFTVYNADGSVYGVMDWNLETQEYEIVVPYGDYTVVETASPEGFILNDTPYQASIVNDGDVVRIEDFNAIGIANSPVTTKIIIYKYDDADSSVLLSGARFSIYEDTNGNGEYDLSDLPAKTYINGELVDATIAEGLDSMGSIVYYTNGELRAGRYFIIETMAPAGYRIDDDQITVVDIPVVDELPEDVSVSISNSCYGDIHITKINYDYPDVRLSGAVFDVFNDVNLNGLFDDEIDIYVGTMNEEETGEYYIRHLGYGHYVVIESVSPEGFIRRNDAFVALVVEDGIVVDIKDAGFEGVYNIPQNGIIQIRKTDAINTELFYTDSVFEVIRDMDGNGIVSDYVFYPGGDLDVPANTDYCVGYIVDDDEDGLYQMIGLQWGTYFVREVDANELYTIDANVYPVVLTEQNPVVAVVNGDGMTFTNSLRTGGLRITKHSADGHIEGITFRVTGTDEAGNSYDETFVTDSNGVIQINNLRIGTYVISEVNNDAVSGYILPDDVTVVIEPDTTINIDMTNTTPTPTVPVVRTGEEASSYLTISMVFIGLSILLGGGCYLSSRRKK